MNFTYSPYVMSREQCEHLTYEKSSPSSAISSHRRHFTFIRISCTSILISLLKRINCYALLVLLWLERAQNARKKFLITLILTLLHPHILVVMNVGLNGSNTESWL